MKTKLITLKGCKRAIEVEVSADAVEGKFEEIYKEIGKAAEIPGFRKGKAPRDIVEKKYSSTASEEVLKDLVSASYEDAIRQLKIVPVDLPQILDVKLVRNQPLSYRAEVDIRPEVKLKKCKGLKIRKSKVKVEDADVEKSLSGLRELHAKFISADERSVSDGDYIICDLACISADKEVFKKESIWLLVNEEGTIKELHGGILGMKKDEEKEIKAKLPKDYPDKELAEKDVLYRVKVKHVKEKKLPPLDDGFAKDLGKSTVRELKEAVKEDLLKRAEMAANENMRNQLIDQLLKNSSFEVPESMTKRQLETLVNSAKDRMLAQGVQEKDVDGNIGTIKEKMGPRAVDQVKVFFLLDEVARSENTKVEPPEVDRAIEILASQLKKDKKKLMEEYEDKNLLQHIIGQIREEKTMEFLLKEAEITEN